DRIRTGRRASDHEYWQNSERDASAEVKGSGVHAWQEALIILRRVHNTEVIEHDIANTGVGNTQQDDGKDAVKIGVHADESQYIQQDCGASMADAQEVTVANDRREAASERTDDQTDEGIRSQQE